MRVGIDASNIRAGGGLTHLQELLSALVPEEHGIDGVTVWACRQTLDVLPRRRWLDLRHEAHLDGALPKRVWWIHRQLDQRLVQADADVLFVPGGVYFGGFRPFVAMSQNILPFDPAGRRRYRWRLRRWRFELLRRAQSATFRRANGVIFVSGFARRKALADIGGLLCPTVVVHHGIAGRFFRKPRAQLAPETCCEGRPFRVLYVSILDIYKHHPEVVQAFGILREAGLPVALDLVGRAYPPARRLFERAVAKVDPHGEFVRYHGPMPYSAVHEAYGKTDLFLFASGSESFGLILLEAMAAALPMVCSCRSAIPEIVGDAAVFFDPADPVSIAAAVERMFSDTALRQRLAVCASDRARQFDWTTCARRTFDFIVKSTSNERC